MSSDLIHFRVGPARLYQFRKVSNFEKCPNFNFTWSDPDPKSFNSSYTVPSWQLKSPLYQPWLFDNQTQYPTDWSPMTKNNEKWKAAAKCGYEGEMGSNRATAKMILQNLNKNNWIDQETQTLFFEQTYFNGTLV